MAARRRVLSPFDREAAAESIARHVCAMPEFEAARRVALYVALPDEVPMDPLATAARASGRELLLPRSSPDGSVFAGVQSVGALRVGRFGVLEPPPDAPAATLGTRDLVLVPGVAFDRAGGRLGRGSGWYDRALPHGVDSPRLFGVGFAFQLVDSVPMAPHDRAVDGFVSEQGILRARPRDRARDPG